MFLFITLQFGYIALELSLQNTEPWTLHGSKLLCFEEANCFLRTTNDMSENTVWFVK